LRLVSVSAGGESARSAPAAKDMRHTCRGLMLVFGEQCMLSDAGRLYMLNLIIRCADVKLQRPLTASLAQFSILNNANYVFKQKFNLFYHVYAIVHENIFLQTINYT
jgi:hypothetical protein